MNTFEEFDRYCEKYNIKPEELGEAFAAFLNLLSKGQWDGEAHEVQ